MTSLRRLVVPVYLLLCLLFGGASAAGYLPNLLLQWIGLGILVWALAAEPPTPVSREGRQLIGLAGLLTALFAVQLIPMPPAIWTLLPGRGDVARGYALLGQDLPWLPISLTPQSTLYSFIWLLPALAVLVAVVRQGAFKASWIGAAVLTAVAFNVLLGALQLAGGDFSPWYLYAVTNRGTAVGLFANGNHTADLLVSSIPLVAALQGRATRRGGSARDRSAIAVMAGACFAVIVLGLLLNFSLAGLGLSLPATAASVLILRGARNKGAAPRWAAPLIAVLVCVSVAGIYFGPFGNNLTDAEQSRRSDSRATNWTRTAAAALDHLPLGSGVGAYQQVYREREDPATVNNTFRNHAHNDLLEVALELGVPGLALIALFGLWWARQTVAIWRGEGVSGYVRAATVVTGVMLAHSLVDYPLRTAGLSALFAAACALMTEPRAAVAAVRDGPKARHLSA